MGNVYKALNARLSKAKGFVKVGFLEGPRYANEDGVDLPVATVAFWNEFGTKRTPPRPFFRRMIAEKSPAWADQFVKILKANGGDVDSALALMGNLIQDQLTNAIREFYDRGNAPGTIKAKGFDKELIDSGKMQKSVGYEVEA